MFGIPAGDGRFGLGALCVAQREDGAAVLRADIVALPVELGGIMSAKEDIEHFGIRDHAGIVGHADRLGMASRAAAHLLVDRKSTRLNSSHVKISYAVFC